jgi:hypothetical protein
MPVGCEEPVHRIASGDAAHRAGRFTGRPCAARRGGCRRSSIEPTYQLTGFPGAPGRSAHRRLDRVDLDSAEIDDRGERIPTLRSF